MPYLVDVTIRDLDRDKQQDVLAVEMFDELVANSKSHGLDGAPTSQGFDDDRFHFKLRIATNDPERARQLAWQALGGAVFAVHARHWIGQPGGDDPLNSMRGISGAQVQLSEAPA